MDVRVCLCLCWQQFVAQRTKYRLDCHVTFAERPLFICPTAHSFHFYLCWRNSRHFVGASVNQPSLLVLSFWLSTSTHALLPKLLKWTGHCTVTVSTSHSLYCSVSSGHLLPDISQTCRGNEVESTATPLTRYFESIDSFDFQDLCV